MSTILVGSELSYDVRKSTVLLLKISAAQTDHQKIVHEELTFDPQPSVEQLEVGLDGNRIYRTVLEPGKWRISYRATIDLQPEVSSPAEVSETAKTQIPPTFCHTQTRAGIAKATCWPDLPSKSLAIWNSDTNACKRFAIGCMTS